MTEQLPTEELIPVLKALAEPNRLRIFAELTQGNSCKRHELHEFTQISVDSTFR